MMQCIMTVIAALILFMLVPKLMHLNGIDYDERVTEIQHNELHINKELSRF